MSKTNRERANTMIVKWHTAVVNREHGLLPLWALNLLIDMVTVLVNKAERRGARKAADVFAENTALKAEIACLKYGTQPQFDAENVKQLIGNLMGSVYYKATINDWFSESQKRAAEIVENDKHALLTALGLEDNDD